MCKKICLFAVGVGWCAFWFWAFSFAYSSSFFRYDPHSRVPMFLAALFAACAIPGSALLQWVAVRRGVRGRLAALVVHSGATCGILAIPFATTFALSRAPDPWHLEADDAMGAGIDNAVLLLLAVAWLLVLGVALLLRPPKARSVD